MAEPFPPGGSLPRPLMSPRATPYKAGTMVTGWNRGRVLFGFPTHHKGHIFVVTSQPRKGRHPNAGYYQDVTCLYDMDHYPRVDGEWLQVRPSEQELEEFKDKVRRDTERLTELLHRLEGKT